MEEEYEDPYVNIYSDPEKFGLELVFEKELSDESYQFDILAVWREIKTGHIFVGRDSGCSCPSPFEDYKSIDVLERVDMRNLENLIIQLRQAEIPMFDLIEIIDDIHKVTEKEKL